MTTARPSGWRTLLGASPFAIPLAAWFATANQLPATHWISLALLPAGCAAAIDTRSLRLPDQLLAISAAIACCAALAIGQSDALLAAAVATGSVLVLHLVNPDWFGFGDVKLAGVLGAVVGLIDWRLSLWMLAGASVIGLVAAGVGRRQAIAFGPALVAAAIAALVVDTASRGAWS